MSDHSLFSQVTQILDGAGVTTGGMYDELRSVHLLRQTSTTRIEPTIYQPLLCLVLQGAKEVGSSTKTLPVGAGESLVVSHTLPVLSRITEASIEAPYTALVVPLDLEILRSLVPAAPLTVSPATSDQFSIRVSETDADLEDALARYFRQCDDDDSRQLLAPITWREIHARLLLGPHAQPLHRLLWHDGPASRIFTATQDIQQHLAKPIVVGDLANRVGMSSSMFFTQFKAVTGTSPLQYQKDLRLLKARDELRTTRAKVSDIALGVGYESSAQFSREYARKFGQSPRRDRELRPVEQDL